MSENNIELATARQETTRLPPGGRAGEWRRSKWFAIAELAVVILIFVADAHHLIRLSKTLYLFLFGWASLWVRKSSWREIGLKLYRNWKTSIVLGIAAGGLLEVLELFITQPLLVKWLGKQPDLEIFRALHGNVKWTLLAIVGAWTIAAFGEEMVYRGYLMNRIADLLNRTQTAWIVSLFAVHIGFGLAHAYQGITGVIDEA